MRLLRALALAILIIASAARIGLAQQDPAPSAADEFVRKSARISALLEKFTGASLSDAIDAAKELAAYGKDAVPYVTEHLKKTNELAIAEYLSALNAKLEKDSLPAEAVMKPEELRELAASVKNKDSVVKAYVYLKYLEASSFYAEKNYARALDILVAVMALDKPDDISDKMSKLRIKCEEQLVSETMFKLSLSSDSKPLSPGDSITYTLKFENVSLAPLSAKIAPDRSGANNPFSSVSVAVTEYNALGDYAKDSAQDEVRMEIDKEFAPGESWTTTLVLDISGLPPQTAPYRIYDVTVSVRPLIKQGEKEFYRELRSNKLQFKVFPVDVKPVVEKPLAMLGKAIDLGTANEIFICSILMAEDDKFAAQEMLMAGMRAAKSEPEKRMFMNCLKQVSGKTLPLEESEWVKWWGEAYKKK